MAGVFPQDLSRGLEAVEHRHANVQNGDVRPRFFGFLDCLAAIAGFGADLPVGVSLDESNQSATYNFVIVSNQNAQAIHRRSSLVVLLTRASPSIHGAIRVPRREQSGPRSPWPIPATLLPNRD